MSIVSNEVGLALCRPILKNTKPSLFLKFEGDSVAQTTAAFIDATKLMVFGCMHKPLVTCDGSHGFKERFIAFNTYGDDYSPSFFNSSLSALDAHSGIIKTWSLGTGKVMQVH